MEKSNKNSVKAVAFIGLLAIAIIVAAAVIVSSRHKDSTATQSTSSSSTQSTSDTTSTSSSGTSDSYKDGSYTATGSYYNPGGTSKIGVTVTIKDDTVTSSSLTLDASDPETKDYQQRFQSGYKSQVVGKKLNQLSLSRVSGSSLTSQGFNNALKQIKSQAQS